SPHLLPSHRRPQAGDAPPSTRPWNPTRSSSFQLHTVQPVNSPSGTPPSPHCCDVLAAPLRRGPHPTPLAPATS
ncbi:hypothetical protein IscW_ISCW013196, partial [Ixodes scapularis]